MVMMMSAGRKTAVHSDVRPDDSYAITHRFSSGFSLENPLQNNDLWEPGQPPFLHQDNLSLSLPQPNWKLFGVLGTARWAKSSLLRLQLQH